MTGRLQWKFLAVNIALIIFVMTTVWLVFDYQAAGYFRDLMSRYGISPVMLHDMFLKAVHRYLVLAGIAAIPIAGLLSFLAIRRMLRPLRSMAAVAGRVAGGDFSQRVEVTGRDEIGWLARSFNRMTESLQRLEELRMTRVIDLAHELKAPLTNIRGYLEAVTDGVLPVSPEMVASLHEETLRLSRLVESLLQTANADAARLTLHSRAVEVRPFILQILQLFSARFAAKSIRVEDRLPGGLFMQVDPDRLAQVVRNLLQNALHYTPHGGRVALDADVAGACVELRFANTGGRIPAAELPNLFDRRFRGRSSASEEVEGTGIGLAIVRELVEAHGGTVGVTHLEDGPCFLVRLPAASRPLQNL